ncbi:MAG: hypothetical protein GF347_01075, partial [Candidatus Moranbacteria bacterium]|nr:hypothetical protein [Candidatus Moranbacteria bacterium]
MFQRIFKANLFLVCNFLCLLLLVAIHLSQVLFFDLKGVNYLEGKELKFKGKVVKILDYESSKGIIVD